MGYNAYGNLAAVEKVKMPDGHEERLLRLETAAQKQAAQGAELSVKIEFISQQVEDKMEYIVRQVEDCRSDLSAQMNTGLSNIAEKVEQLTSQAAPLVDKVRSLEMKEQERSERSAKISKLFWGVVMAGAGVIGVKLTEFLLARLGG